MERSEAARKRVIFGLVVVLLGAGLALAGTKLQRHIQFKRYLAHREEMLDLAIQDTMDASDATAKY